MKRRPTVAAESRVTKETVEKMARDVIGIDLSPTEIDQLTPQLDKLLTDLAQIPDADLQDIEPPLFFHAGEPEQA
jgi:Asp-tRNA(Asn)/Glu-tRNA(Gln) amidotransferase C subunit